MAAVSFTSEEHPLTFSYLTCESAAVIFFNHYSHYFSKRQKVKSRTALEMQAGTIIQ